MPENAPLKVLAVIGKLDVGGAERHLLQVLPRLNRSAIMPAVFVLHSGGVLTERMRAAGVSVFGPPGRLPRYVNLIVSAFCLVKALWKLRPDIIHFFLPEAYIVGGLVSLPFRAPLRVMSRRSLNNYQQRRRFSASLERRLHAGMAAVLANSQAVLAQIAAEGIPPEKLHLLYSGIELLPARDPAAGNVIRKSLGLDDQAFIIVNVANLIPYKGHMDLLFALAGVVDELPAGWRLLCIGRDDGLGPALRKIAADLRIEEHLLWLGQRDDVADILSITDIGVLPSHEEGFSNSILEMMAAAVPVVVTDVGGNREAVVDGTTGRIVAPRDRIALGETILDLSRQEATLRDYGAAARQRAASEFSLDNCVDAYERFYLELAARS